MWRYKWVRQFAMWSLWRSYKWNSRLQIERHKGCEFDGTTCIDAKEYLDQEVINVNAILDTNTSDGTYHDANECLDGSVCNDIGTCINLGGGFDCGYPSGYKSDPEQGGCVDINECKVEKHICGKGAVCLNSHDSVFANLDSLVLNVNQTIPANVNVKILMDRVGVAVILDILCKTSTNVSIWTNA